MTMTISIRISVNGNYKCPVSYRQGDREVTETISGRGHPGPKHLDVAFYHGADAMTLIVGPEEQDIEAQDGGGTGNGPPPK